MLDSFDNFLSTFFCIWYSFSITRTMDACTVTNVCNIFALYLSSRSSMFVFIHDYPIKVFAAPLSSIAEILLQDFLVLQDSLYHLEMKNFLWKVSVLVFCFWSVDRGDWVPLRWVQLWSHEFFLHSGYCFGGACLNDFIFVICIDSSYIYFDFLDGTVPAKSVSFSFPCCW